MLGAAGALSSIAEESAAFKATNPDGCFIAGTSIPVIDSGAVVASTGTSNVSYKAIEDIHVIDIVVSRNAVTGATENKKVTRTFKHEAAQTITVTLADASGKVVQSLTATPEHPFYVGGRGMVSLSQLDIGTQIVTRAGPALVVQSIKYRRRASGYAVYNIVVEDDHSYFVGKTDGGTWVHNGVGDCDFGNLTLDEFKRIIYKDPGNVQNFRDLLGKWRNGASEDSIIEAGHNLSTDALLAYRQAAQNAIDLGGDATGVQAGRIDIINKYLKTYRGF